MRRAEARQCRDEVDAVVSLDRLRQRLALRRVVEEAEGVAEPLDRRSGDEDRALEGVDGLLAVQPPGRSPQEAFGRRPCVAAGVGEDEAARSVRRLHLSGRVAPLAEERRLLVAGDSRDRDPSAEKLGLGDRAARVDDLRQDLARHPEELEQLVVPLEALEAEEHGARGVRDVGGVNRAAGQLPEEPGVDGAEGEVGRLSARLVEEPLELRRGEIGIRDEAGALPDQVRAGAPRSARQSAGPARRSRGAPDDPSSAPRAPWSRAGS